MIRAAVLYMLAMLATACATSVTAAVVLLGLVGFASIVFLTTGTARSRSPPRRPIAAA